ncbi:hypothetical protein SanaruYs_33810 [Chryseotalea sanaruensis]|uniref:Lipoprotein n=1 Tax=Chryseotalea sanaruensis TaxID=2482724 RepID=A0A401UE05_9BACT|nr:hypothetical protein [Chryseotalea sanaruensis]GCC53138.1 hypothetical protein SanaruYs_33810 [Chryseotalea sanaruensis]
MKYFSLLIYPFLAILSLSCSSGKKAYEKGDYYAAVIKSVERLRQKPDHTKSQEALKLSYPLAIDFLETQAQSTIASDAPFKWKQAIGYYSQINVLHDQIKTSPAALSVIKSPVSKFNEIADLKKKAADESYEAGIQAMMKNSRAGAIEAFYLFQEANNFDPGIKDVVELQHKAEYDATLRIVYAQQVYRNNWVAVEPLINNLRLPFTKFYTTEQAEAEEAPIHHTLLIEVLGYNEGRPSTTKTETNHTDSVQVERTMGGKKVKVYEKVTGRSTLYEKRVASQGGVRLTIKEKETAKQLMNNEYTGTGNWSDTWARCSGDNRAIPERIRKICSKSEPEPNNEIMLRQAREDLLKQVESSLSSFYRL